jgi:hypothetical protein
MKTFLQFVVHRSSNMKAAAISNSNLRIIEPSSALIVVRPHTDRVIPAAMNQARTKETGRHPH